MEKRQASLIGLYLVTTLLESLVFQEFMVWKFPRRAPNEMPSSRWNEELTNDMINQVHKRLCQTTYQTDYLAIPQGKASLLLL